MRQFNLKCGYLVPDPVEAESAPDRTIYPEALRMAEPGWAEPWWGNGETVVRPEDVVEDEEHAAAREWLRHLEAGRLG